MSIDIQEYRRNKLAKLLAEYKSQGKSVAKLAQEYPIDPSFISQLKNKHRGFGEEAARNLEESLGLKQFYFEPYYEQMLEATESDNHIDRINALSSFDREVLEDTNRDLDIGEIEEEFPMFFIADVLYVSESEQGEWIDCTTTSQVRYRDLIVIGSNISTSAYAVIFETDEFFPAIRPSWVGLFDPANGVDSGDLTHVVLQAGAHFLKEYLYSKNGRYFFASLNSNERDSFLLEDIKEMSALRGLMPSDCISKKIESI